MSGILCLCFLGLGVSESLHFKMGTFHTGSPPRCVFTAAIGRGCAGLRQFLPGCDDAGGRCVVSPNFIYRNSTFVTTRRPPRFRVLADAQPHLFDAFDLSWDGRIHKRGLQQNYDLRVQAGV